MRRLLLFVFLLLAIPGQASAQWGEAPVTELGDQGVATCLRDAGGGRVASVALDDGAQGVALHTVTADGLRPDGVALFPGRLDGCTAVAAADSGAAVVAAVMRTERRGDRLGPPRLVVSVREPGGAFGTPSVLARGRKSASLLATTVAVGAGGRAAVAWLEVPNGPLPGPFLQRLRVARREPGGAFGPPETLISRARSDFSFVEPVLGYDAGGVLTAAWARPRARPAIGYAIHTIEAATAAPGRTFGAPQRIAPRVQDPDVLSLAVVPDGRALLAFDGDGRVRVHERPARTAAFGAEPVLTTDAGPVAPAVALAPDGGAVVAWRGGSVTALPLGVTAIRAQEASDGVAAVTRPPGGAFGAEQRLAPSRDPGSSGVSLYTVDGASAPFDPERERVRAVAGPGGRAVVTWTAASAQVNARVRGGVAVATGSGFAPSAALGSPVRDVDALVPWLGTDGPAAVWADNSTTYAILPTGRGRLHVSAPDRTPASPPPPAVSPAARPQALHYREPLVVTARCAAACDLRATLSGYRSRRPDGVRPGAAVATGGRADPGIVRLRLAPLTGHIAPKAGGRVRVVVRATAPGGREVGETAVRVRVRRRTPPPLQRPLDVRARRDGDDVVLTWRTAGPARRMSFFAFGRRTRGTGIPQGRIPRYATREGNGDRRFRVRLRDVPRVRWVVLQALSADPPPRRARVVVPVR